eukprot:3526903-Pyramimonas_sp.AAC.1
MLLQPNVRQAVDLPHALHARSVHCTGGGAYTRWLRGDARPVLVFSAARKLEVRALFQTQCEA